MNDSVGVYISVPFCKAKCSYCNFASGVFGPARMERYVERVCSEIASTRKRATGMQAMLPQQVDTIYFGGGTPSLLSAGQVKRLFGALRAEFTVSAGAEVTVECAPGQLVEETFGELQRQGMNRVSFGVQSFVDEESRAVGRSHTRVMCLAEIARMRAAGLDEINVDLIVGLPRQTAASWRESVDVALESGVPHVSMYMLEIDDDSRLGRELLTDGTRYGAGDVATEDETAERYGAACEWLEAGGVRQYEISNFARARIATGKSGMDHRSLHNVKYWRRDPYVGFGLDAHSMLRNAAGAVRWANASELETYLASTNEVGAAESEHVGREHGFEEAMFLGLRMNEGVDLKALRGEFGDELMCGAVAALDDVEEAGLVVREGSQLRLTASGRMASNEVFSRLLVVGC